MGQARILAHSGEGAEVKKAFNFIFHLSCFLGCHILFLMIAFNAYALFGLKEKGIALGRKVIIFFYCFCVFIELLDTFYNHQ